MKLRTQIVVLGLSGALMAALVGGIGLLASAHMGDVIEEALLAGQALQTSQQADMMHDAVRGDGQLAMLGLLEKNPGRIADAEKGLKEHTASFNDAVARLKTLPLSPASRDALAAAEPLIASYTQAADAVVKASKVDAEALARVAPALQTAFSELEGRMATLSDTIGKHGEELNKRAEASVGEVRRDIGLALVLGTVAMLVAALGLAKRMARPMAHAVDVADRLAEGDLTAPIQAAGNDETTHLLQALARMQSSFASTLRDVQANAEAVATASAQIAQGNLDLSGRTEQQAASLQQTAATMDELGSTVRNNADNARQANQLAEGASSVAVKGGEVMGEVVATMSGINDSSRRIADIIGTIDGIAFQTNILALNAAVEAARAGEQGRGFAVVASEVRSLAQRSAEAAREVKSLVNASVERVEAGTTLVGRAGQTMEEIVLAIRRVTDIVAEISSASAEQSTGVTQVNQAVSLMDRATQQNAAVVEQSAASAEALSRQARQLVQAVSAFRVGGAVALPAAAPPAPVRAERPAPPPAGRARPAPRPVVAPVVSPAAPVAVAAGAGSDEWESF